MALKSIKLNLQSNVVTSYDQTKTTVVGNITQYTVDSKSILAPDRTRWFDVFTDAAVTPTGVIEYTTNNRIFTISGEAAGAVNMALHTYDPNTKTKSYLGKIIFNIVDSPATTHTFRAIKAVDTGTTGWKIFIVSTGSVTANGGLYMLNDIALSDFSVSSPPTIPLASAGGQKAVYKLENSPFTLTAGKGIILDTTNTRVYVHNGVSATHQYYKFNYSNSITTVTSGITTNLFEFVTGNLPALSGTLLQTNSENLAQPTSGVNSGFDCGFFSTTTNFYRFKLSDLTNGGTTLPSLENVNVDGAVNEYTTSQPLNAFFSNVIQRVIYACNQPGVFFVKSFVNSVIEASFGTNNLLNSEAESDPIVLFGFQTVDGMMVKNACLIASSNTAGQRGLLSYDLRSHYLYDYSYFVTPVVNVDTYILKKLVLERIASHPTSTVVVYYRTSGFGSITGGWTAISGSSIVTDIESLAPTVNIQFKVLYNTAQMCGSNPAEIIEGYLIVDTTISENLDSILAQLQTDHTNFQTDHTNFQADHTNFQADHTAFVADDAAFDADHANFQADHLAFVADDAAFDTDHANFQSDHTDLQSDHSDLQSDHANFQNDHSDLQSDHNNFQDDHNDLQSDHSDLQSDHSNFQSDLSDLEAAIDDIEASSGTLVSAIDAIAGGPTLEVEDSEAAELEVDTDDDLDLEVEE